MYCLVISHTLQMKIWFAVFRKNGVVLCAVSTKPANHIFSFLLVAARVWKDLVAFHRPGGRIASARSAQLANGQFVKQSLFLHQLIIGTAFLNLTMIQYKNAIAVHDGG